MKLRINSRAPTADHPLDAYWTSPEAVKALMEIETLPRSIADPCCGSGAILNVLEAAGHVVHGADVVDYGWRPGCTVIRDYLADPVEMNGVGIVTNPPFSLAEKFIRKAIGDGCHYHAWLLRLQFLTSRERVPFWEDFPASRILIPAPRFPMMHRAGWEGKRSGSNVDHAWFVWDDSGDKMRVCHFIWKKARSRK